MPQAAGPIVFALLALTASFSRAQPAEDNQTRVARVDRQILVMLKMPAPHMRPGSSYAGSYDVGAGREARRRYFLMYAFSFRYSLGR